jgi:hypothetical protein
MNVTIEIHYTGDSKIAQKGSFPLRGKKCCSSRLRFLEANTKRNALSCQIG